MRVDGRSRRQLRPVKIKTGYLLYPEGSVLFSMGQTRVLCSATIQGGVPAWLENDENSRGWITAEYALLPRSTQTRVSREKGSFSSRSQEIRRLIGRSLRAGFDLSRLGSRTCILDCDVLQADGGTRTAAITGGYLALRIALQELVSQGDISPEVFLSPVAAVSVGMSAGSALLDLCYQEDVSADADLNVVMNQEGKIIEVQGTAEGDPFSPQDLEVMVSLAGEGISQLIKYQFDALDPAE